MAKGKYAQRADTRLKVLESEALREAHAKIADLSSQLSEAKHEINIVRSEISSKALQAASGLSTREKQNLRNQIASMEHQRDKERIRYALLTWEIMHRNKFGVPAPLRVDPSCGDSYKYWIGVNWELASLFCPDWESIREFFLLVEGYEWKIAGDNGLAGKSGDPLLKQSAREADRLFKKGRIKDRMMVRVSMMKAHHDRVYKARRAGKTEPILMFRATETDSRISAEDRHDRLINRMREKASEQEAQT